MIKLVIIILLHLHRTYAVLELPTVRGMIAEHLDDLRVRGWGALPADFQPHEDNLEKLARSFAKVLLRDGLKWSWPGIELVAATARCGIVWRSLT